jgi:hypothetical protein
MRTHVWNYLFCMTIILSGCSKNNDNNVPDDQSISDHIKAITILDTTGLWLSTISYQYDSQNRLQNFFSKQRGTSNDTIYVNYSMRYYNNIIQMIRTFPSTSTFFEKITYIINSKGFADSSVHVISASTSDSVIISNDRFIYNSEGYLMTHMMSSEGGTLGTMRYFYSNSNVDSITFSPSNPTSNKQQFYYDLGHLNTLSYDNVGIQFLGKSTKNPLMRARMETSNVDIARYSYEYDQSGRIFHLSVRGFSAMPGYDFYSVPILMLNEELYYSYY